MFGISTLKSVLAAASRAALSAAHPCPSPRPPHTFLQRFPVSGTPKGKARLKAMQVLKKKSFTNKKKGKDADLPSFKGGRGPPIAKTRPIILRLNARLRRREAEREKLGLVSKLRQRDLQIQTARAEKGSKSTLTGLEGADLCRLGFVDPRSVPAWGLTVEDGRRLAKEYSRLLLRWDRERQWKEMWALRLRTEAVKALPEKLRITALMPIPKRKKEDAVEEEKKKVVGKGKKKTSKKPGSFGKKPQKKG